MLIFHTDQNNTWLWSFAELMLITAAAFPSSVQPFISCLHLSLLAGQAANASLFLSSTPPPRPSLFTDWPVTVLRLSSVTRQCWPAESSGANSTGRSASTCAAMTASCRPVVGVCRRASNRCTHTHNPPCVLRGAPLGQKHK